MDRNLVFSDRLESVFSCYGKVLSHRLSEMILSFMQAKTAKTGDVATALCQINNQSFKANTMNIYRFFSSPKLQIDDRLWRLYFKVLFGFLTEQKLVKKGDLLRVKIDFTSLEDNFLILFASLQVGEVELPLFFTMRRYPKRKNMLDQKKMELAFMKGLSHCLSKNYKYLIVADRGFGNQRFLQICEDLGFDFVIRTRDNLRIKTADNQGIMREIFTENKTEKVEILAWQKEYFLTKNEHNGGIWYLLSPYKIKHSEAVAIYKSRFRIEKLFKNLKSSGYDLEKLLVRKYYRIKKIIFVAIFAYALNVILASFIKEKLPQLQKKFPLHTDLLTACFISQDKYYHSQKYSQNIT